MADVATRSTIIGLIVAVAAGCGTSAQSHFYTLDPVAIVDHAPPSNLSVIVAPVRVPATVDQPQFVIQVAQNRAEVEEFDRWVAPLDESIASAVAGDLSILLASPEVVTAPLADFSPQYRVAINVQRFESVKGESTLLVAVWTVRSAVNGKITSGRTVAREPAQGEAFEALAAAHSRGLAKLSSDIATAIRAEAAVNS